ncbi:hypothetical protein Taro_040843, partial [Colocasia esculenta]|nr:hypothetical protein [Colocasia esculenta]
ACSEDFAVEEEAGGLIAAAVSYCHGLLERLLILIKHPSVSSFCDFRAGSTMMIKVLQIIHRGTRSNTGQRQQKGTILVLRSLNGTPIGTKIYSLSIYVGKGRFEFCYNDDEDFETIFKSAFKGKRGFYWSFSSGENFNWGYSSGYEGRSGSSNWGYSSDYVEDDTSTMTDLAVERLTLGLRASGPLKLEEVKKAYRACALRWHPDRHQGSSKVEAEEKFKNCSAAYESLCEKRIAADNGDEALMIRRAAVSLPLWEIPPFWRWMATFWSDAFVPHGEE